MMISGPVPDWIAEVMRACRSLALMVSTLSVMPVAFWHSCVIWPLSSTSEAGTKSAQRSQWTVVPCAKAGARPVARTAARPPVCAATAPDADSFRSLRRVMRAMCFPLSLLCAGIERARLRRCARRGVVCQPGASRPERPAECSRVRRRSRIRRFSPNRTRNLGAGRRAHPGLMPATWTTQVQRLSLPGIVASDSSGVMPITSTPRLGEALRLGVKLRQAHCEQMFSALPLRADLHGPTRDVAEVPQATRLLKRKASINHDTRPPNEAASDRRIPVFGELYVVAATRVVSSLDVR